MSRIFGLLACTLPITLNIACAIEPSDERPGFGLSGEVNKQRVQDWSFASDASEIFIETATPYFIPHSVTIACATLENQLYVGANDPDNKRWVANVARDPNVRLKIGNKIYEQKLDPITDAATIDMVEGAYARKYEYEAGDANEEVSIALWHVVERD